MLLKGKICSQSALALNKVLWNSSRELYNEKQSAFLINNMMCGHYLVFNRSKLLLHFAECKFWIESQKVCGKCRCIYYDLMTHPVISFFGCSLRLSADVMYIDINVPESTQDILCHRQSNVWWTINFKAASLHSMQILTSSSSNVNL